MPNKIKYGLSNVYYAVGSEDESGALTYNEPVAWLGAVSLTLSASGEENTFYADNIPYFQLVANNGYTGTFESALVPDSFKTDVMGELVGANGIKYENSDVNAKPFALLFQIEGDANKTRYVLYNVIATRPDVSGSTKEASITPQTETISITAMPRKDNHITKGQVSDVNSEVYNAWYTQVQLPTISEGE